MAVNRIGNSTGKGSVIRRDVFTDAKSVAIDETIAHGKDFAGDEDDVNAASGQDTLVGKVAQVLQMGSDWPSEDRVDEVC